jgi:hypothetical protein
VDHRFRSGRSPAGLTASIIAAPVGMKFMFLILAMAVMAVAFGIFQDSSLASCRSGPILATVGICTAYR